MQLKIVLLLWFSIGLTQAADPAQNCEKDYEDQQWERALMSCQKALKGTFEEVSEITILDHLAHITGYLEDDEQTLHYDQLIEQHPAFKTTIKFQYNWQRRKGRQAFSFEQYEQARIHYDVALNIANEQNNILWQSKVHNDLGVLSKQQGYFTEALSHYQQSLALKLQLGDDFIIANTQYNIGHLLLKLERPTAANEYLHRAIRSFQKYADSKPNIDQETLQKSIDHIYEVLVLSHLKLDHPDKANEYINKIVHSKSIQNTDAGDFNSENASTNLTLAQFYINEKKPLLAQVFLDQAVTIEPKRNVMSVLRESIKIKLLLNDQISEAKKIAKLGLTKAQELNDLYYQAVFNQFLSEFLEQENPSESLAYFKAYHQARETFLAKKYHEDIDTINFKIKSNQIERDLFEEQLINSQKEKRIITLTNWVLMALIGLIGLLALFSYFYLKKSKEKQALLKSIEFHKQQWLLLNANQEQQKSDTGKTPAKQALKETLVRAMVEAVDVWNRHKGHNRIDLAEKSKIWTITIDNGVLRTRSMDKYLSIKQIPENPRWRKVVRTCHFILADSTLGATDRMLLNDNLEKIINIIKGLSENPSS